MINENLEKISKSMNLLFEALLPVSPLSTTVSDSPRRIQPLISHFYDIFVLI